MTEKLYHMSKALNAMNLPMDAQFRYCQHGDYFYDYVADNGEIMLVSQKVVEFVATLSRLGII